MTDDPKNPTQDEPAGQAGGSLRLDAVAAERPTPPQPDTQQVAGDASTAAPEPTSTVPDGEASFSHPAGTAAPGGGDAAAAPALTDRPEVMVGAAFAGGLLVATILKRLGR